MDPRAIVHPVGSLPPRVYWARRMIPLTVLVVIIAAIAVSCSGGGSAPARSAADTHTPSPHPSTPAAVAACTRVQLTITASTDATSYPGATLPHLTATVRNASARPCRFADGASIRSFAISSGPDQVWTDAGCVSSQALVNRTLAAGASVRHTLIWNRHRSGPHCTTSSTSAAPGTYRLYVTVRDQRSAAAIFHLTG
jgi:hypothetical protein